MASSKKLSDYIDAIAFKYLSAVDTSPARSNQHEVRSQQIKKVLGDPGSDTKIFNATFIYLGKDIDNPARDESTVSWYDTRSGNPHRSQECALYYRDNLVTELMSEGDLFLIMKKTDRSLLIIIVPSGTSEEQRIKWLFGIDSGSRKEEVVAFQIHNETEIGFSERYILEELGVELEEIDDNYLDLILSKFGGCFPKTKEFSMFARNIFKNDCSAIDDPDHAILTFMNGEELLFRTLENHLISQHITTGFSDTDKFMEFAKSVLNRRNSRAGHAFENHLEQIFLDHSIKYSRGKTTEKKSKPDFIFPGTDQYQLAKENEELRQYLTMLGAKTSCKDRWRQVTKEAELIQLKHLVTLEPGISRDQTEEMKRNNIQLVVPTKIQDSYTSEQKKWLNTLSDFIKLVNTRQMKF